MELHIPMAQFGLALQVIMRCVNETQHNVNFIVGVRFMPQDSAGIWLVCSTPSCRAGYVCGRSRRTTGPWWPLQ